MASPDGGSMPTSEGAVGAPPLRVGCGPSAFSRMASVSPRAYNYRGRSHVRNYHWARCLRRRERDAQCAIRYMTQAEPCTGDAHETNDMGPVPRVGRVLVTGGLRP